MRSRGRPPPRCRRFWRPKPGPFDALTRVSVARNGPLGLLDGMGDGHGRCLPPRSRSSRSTHGPHGRASRQARTVSKGDSRAIWQDTQASLARIPPGRRCSTVRAISSVRQRQVWDVDRGKDMRYIDAPVHPLESDRCTGLAERRRYESHPRVRPTGSQRRERASPTETHEATVTPAVCCPRILRTATMWCLRYDKAPCA